MAHAAGRDERRVSIFGRAAAMALLLGLVPAWSAAQVVTTSIAAGSFHSCSLSTTGAVKCWGYNVDGQLGDGTTNERHVPVDVAGLNGGIAAVTAGFSHTCALTEAGGVKCWGSNANGQLGDNTVTRRLMPVDVTGMTSGVAAIAAGGNHTCALTAAGAVKCWGHNAYGQLGDNTTTQRLTAADVAGLASGVAAIAAGGGHSCAIVSGGALKCWGANTLGQLGDNTTATERLAPVNVLGLTSGVVAVEAGNNHTCALLVSGTMKCWGDNLYGQVGDGSNVRRLAPVDVAGISGIASIAAGGQHTCAVTSAGGVKCWGDNLSGQVGDGTPIDRNAPVDVAGLATGAASVAGGLYHTCAVTSGGAVKCWGNNSAGQIGDNTSTHERTPVDVTGLASGVATVTAGDTHTCARTTGGGLKCWGANVFGQLGDGTTTQRFTPADVAGLSSAVASAHTRMNHSCAVTAAGGAKCWGTNGSGQLGDGTTIGRTLPVDVSGLGAGVAAIAPGGTHTCALTSGSAVKCWGANSSGQLGDNSTTQSSTPVDVAGLAGGIAAITAGSAHTCALTTGGGVKCWGSNLFGHLGDGTTADRHMPVDVSGLASGVVAISAGLFHTCALTTAGGVKCWGHNFNGELGDNTTTERLVPTDVLGLTAGVAGIAGGGAHTCALTTGGGVECWGANPYGQLGDGTTTQRLAKVDVTGLSSGVAAIAAGSNHTCAVTTGGAVKCWGNNISGQLSSGGATNRLTPVNVVGLASASSQTISFSPPATATVGTPLTLSATASSGLPVQFDTWTPSTCTVSGTTLTPVAAGLCGVRASQPGDVNYPPASQQLRWITVNEAPVVTPTTRLFGIATRANVLTADNVMIAGFIIGGSTAKTVVVRARGPSLGVAGALADPVLTLVPASGSPVTNNDWGNAPNAAQISASGFAPADARESAILAALDPGAYTAIVSGFNNGTGVGIVEVYEIDGPSIPLVGISTRAQVQTADNVMIGGFIIQGSDPLTVVIRARGPSLGVPGALANPTLTLVPASGSPITNDDWQTATNAAQLLASGLQPGHPNESAILVTLNPGAYTAIVSGVGGTTGVAIVEVYRQ